MINLYLSRLQSNYSFIYNFQAFFQSAALRLLEVARGHLLYQRVVRPTLLSISLTQNFANDRAAHFLNISKNWRYSWLFSILLFQLDGRLGINQSSLPALPSLFLPKRLSTGLESSRTSALADLESELILN